MKVTGTKYQETKDLDIKDIAKLIRAEIKQTFPTWKVSVTIDRYSMGQAINADIGFADGETRDYSGSITDYGKSARELIRKIIEQYNFDDSDSMTDYYHVRFAGHVTLAY